MYQDGVVWKSIVTNPYDEVVTQQQGLKTQYLCGLEDLKNREGVHLYIKRCLDFVQRCKNRIIYRMNGQSHNGIVHF